MVIAITKIIYGTSLAGGGGGGGGGGRERERERERERGEWMSSNSSGLPQSSPEVTSEWRSVAAIS